jgi:hypothetical protein
LSKSDAAATATNATRRGTMMNPTNLRPEMRRAKRVAFRLFG